jgi:hypothetical protein
MSALTGNLAYHSRLSNLASQSRFPGSVHQISSGAGATSQISGSDTTLNRSPAIPSPSLNLPGCLAPRFGTAPEQT